MQGITAMLQWVFIGYLLGSTVTSQHDTREACEGRAVMLREKGVVGQCVQVPGQQFSTGLYSGSTNLGILVPNVGLAR